MKLGAVRLWLAVALLATVAGAPRPGFAQATGQIDPARYLPQDDQLPDGFERQHNYDRVIEEPGVIRVVRFYARGAPDVPSDEHASILLAVALSDSAAGAATDFHETVASWRSMGYGLHTLETDIGDEAVGGWDGFFGMSDHPKQGAVVLLRFGPVVATVQWVDDPGQTTIEDVLAIARLIEARA